MFASFGQFIMMSMSASMGMAGSDCGQDFDDYTRRVVHEPFENGASRSTESLWKNRKFRLYQNSTDFRVGKVISWTQARHTFLPLSFWKVTLEMDTMGSGDSVVIQGLPKKHDGKKGIIIKTLPNGKFKVKLDDNDLTFVTVKREHLKTGTTTFTVNRMNIDGGGTLKDPETGFLVSLEWLDPASPSIDLDEGILRAVCPTCRAVEPLLKAYDDEAETNHADDQECPICMESTTCRTLTCSHDVCHECWQKWRNSSPNIPVAAPEMNPDRLQRERDVNFQRVRAFLPHTMGGTGSKPSDTQATWKHICERADERIDGILESLVRDDGNGREGLVDFWKRMLSCSIHVFCMEACISFLVRRLTIPAMEILLQVSEERSDEISSGLQQMFPNDHGNSSLEYIYSMKAKFCNQLGMLQEEEDSYRAAIPWYTRSVYFAKKRLEADTQHNEANCKLALSAQHCNLGLAQKRAGFYNKAMENYDISLGLRHNEDVEKNKETLETEMKQWTGSSGKLTPGC